MTLMAAVKQVGAYPFEDPQYPNSDIRTFQARLLV